MAVYPPPLLVHDSPERTVRACVRWALSCRASASALQHPVLVIVVAWQSLFRWETGHLTDSYPVSTAARGCGNRSGSLQTPLGLHRIAERIGDLAPLGTRFRGRRPLPLEPWPSGEYVHSGSDPITTRILWLEGLEVGYNQGGDCDTRMRYIYLHGTDDESRIGQPVSQGCIRLRNLDMLDLYTRTPLHSLVVIV